MDKPADLKRPDRTLVACKVCLREIPVSEASSREASDYVVHFCGLECYEIWRQQDAGDASEVV